MRNLQDLTDEELALLYVEGNNRAFDLLLSRNEVKLFTYIMFFVRDQEVANDIFQETFLKVVSKLQNHEYSANGKFGGWLMRIAHNVLMDMYRGQRYKYVVESKDDNDLSNISGDEFFEGMDGGNRICALKHVTSTYQYVDSSLCQAWGCFCLYTTIHFDEGIGV